MEAIQFLGTTPQELVKEIKDSLIPELRAELSKEFEPKKPTEYLTRSEVCKLLKIDLSTLWRWQKNGTLQGYALNNRVYFKRSEIDDVLNTNRI